MKLILYNRIFDWKNQFIIKIVIKTMPDKKNDINFNMNNPTLKDLTTACDLSVAAVRWALQGDNKWRNGK